MQTIQMRRFYSRVGYHEALDAYNEWSRGKNIEKADVISITPTQTETEYSLMVFYWGKE